MGNSLTPIQDSADKAKTAFKQLNDTLNGTASASASAASRAAEQAKTGNQNESDKEVSDAVEKLNKDVTGGIDTMKKDLVDEVGELGDSIRGLNFVLDTGVLVANLLPKIDHGLGVRASMKRRG
jgi:methyl-accepting chemotaxis protein